MNKRSEVKENDERLWRNARLWLLKISYQTLAGSSAVWALTQKEIGSLVFFELFFAAGFFAMLAEWASRERSARKNR